VLGRSLDDLPPQTRRLLLLVDQMVSAACEREKIERNEYRFSRRDVRVFTGWGDTQLRVHLERLEQLEYLLAHRGGRGQSFVYELMFTVQGNSNGPLMPGLIDVAKLGGRNYDGNLAGSRAEFAGQKSDNAASTRGHHGGVAGSTRSEESPVSMRVPSPLAVPPLKIASPDEAEPDRIVAVQPRSMNGNNGHHRGGTVWPA
jgi:hypothetical protein